MNTNQLIAKLKQYPLAVVCVVVILVMLVLTFLRMDRIPTLNAEYQTLLAEADQIKSNNNNAVDLTANLEKLNELVANIESRLIDPDATTDNYAYFLSLKEKAKVDMVDPPNGQLSKDSNMKVYPLVEFPLDVSGSFENVMKFVYELRTGKYILRVDNFSLTPVEKPGVKNNVRASIRVSGIAEPAPEVKKK